MNIYRYSEWDATQQLPGFNKDELMDELAHGIMRDGDLSYLLWKMQRQDLIDGEERLTGLQQLLKRLQEARQKQQAKYDFSSMLDVIRNKMDDIIKLEQANLQEKLKEAKQSTDTQNMQKIEQMVVNNLKQLKDLPSDIGGKIKELQKYDFTDDDARQQFQNIMEPNLESLTLEGTLEGASPFMGKESISFDEAMHLMETLQQMDKLRGQIEDAQYGSSKEPIDPQTVRELLGEQAVGELEMPGITEVLEEAQYIRRKGEGFTLTPLGMRKIGEKALRDIFSQLHKDKFGGHNVGSRGALGKRSEETKRFEFGDNFDIELKQTIMNALTRGQKKLPLKLEVTDFEVYKSEQSMRSATVLMLDLSLSMSVRDNFYAAKHVAIALEGLIRSQFPRDSLYIVGFSSFAREIKKEDLVTLRLDQADPYTNIQSGLELARKLLVKDKSRNKQIIIVTDGEPTAHVEEGQISYHFSPGARTLQLTMREVENCTKQGITINTFMLGESNLHSAFITRIAKINKGRVFFANADGLGKYILVDYMAARRKGVK